MIGKIIYQDFWHTVIENMEFEEKRAVFDGHTGDYLYTRGAGNILKSVTDYYGKNIPLWGELTP